MRIKDFKSFNESISIDDLDRKKKVKIDLTQVDFAYHWLTEGKLFDACYANYGKPGEEYVLKRGKMPALPPVQYELKSSWNNSPQICLTVDPFYSDPAFNEDGACIVFDFKKLKSDYEIEDLTDNGESEIRIKNDIIDWQKYMIRVDIGKKSYLTGQGWEDFRFRALKDWLPEEIKSKVTTFTSIKQLLKDRRNMPLTTKGENIIK